MTSTGGENRSGESDAARAIRFMAVKAAIFILVPLAVALLAVYFNLS